MRLKNFLKGAFLQYNRAKRIIDSALKIKILSGNPGAICISFVLLFLCFQNYNFGTWLSGWDTLHPEFNFPLYLKRIFFGVWQEHQGLGAVGAQAHIAEIPRVIFLWLASFIVPDSFLRYLYFFVTLFVGSLGMYFFLKTHLVSVQKAREIISTIGAFVYTFNLSTLAHYYVPLEMFATHFAALPWLFYFALEYLKGKSKSLLYFALVSLFTASQAHTATLFYTYFAGLIVTVGAFVFLQRSAAKQSLIIIVSTLIVNSFWLLPNIYFVLNEGQNVTQSKIHSMFSEKAFLTGKKFGTVQDVAILKNFLFDWGEYDDTKGQFVDLFDEWQPHLNNVLVRGIGYSVFALVIVGIVYSLVLPRQYGRANIGVVFLPLFSLSFLFIANDNFFSNGFFALLEKSSPLLKEAFRFPFTKFSILLAFTYAVFVSLSLSFLQNKLAFLLRRDSWFYLLTSVLGVAILFYMLPAFQGNLISESMKTKFPHEYFEMFDWFEDKEGRIAPFPAETYWGWIYYNWQHEGAGFRWFGLKPPILDREFDRWSPYNENYYWEVSYALYSQNRELLENVFEKYNVDWLLLDKSVINPSSPKSLYLDEFKNLLALSNKVSKEKEFGELEIYKFHKKDNYQKFITLKADLPHVSPRYRQSNYDQAFQDMGMYLSRSTQEAIFYPFRTLFSGKLGNLGFVIEEGQDFFIFRKRIPDLYKEYDIYLGKEGKLTWVDVNSVTETNNVKPGVSLKGNVLDVKIPKVFGLLSAKLDPGYDSEITKNFETALQNCNTKKGSAKNLLAYSKSQVLLRLASIDTNNCSAYFWLPYLTQNSSYLISVENRNLRGKSLLFWIENLNSRRSDLEVYLPKAKELTTSYFIQPPMEEYAVGYTLHFDNISTGREPSINDLGKISINPLPFDFLVNISFRPKILTNASSVGSATQVTHTVPSLYEVYFPDDGYIVLSQSYHKGWHAYRLSPQTPSFLAPFVGKEIREHELVNNWANAWRVKDSLDIKITIIFLPQYLQYLGILLLVVYFSYLIFVKKVWQDKA